MFGFKSMKSCPQCGKKWEDALWCHHCGYELKYLICPKCAKYLQEIDIVRYNKILLGRTDGMIRVCECRVPYTELDLTTPGMQELTERLRVQYADMNPGDEDIKFDWLIQRYIYENLFDKSGIDHNNKSFKRNYAYMYPESKESKEYFNERCTTYENMTKPASQRQSVYDKKPESQPKHIPTCPICKSTNLSKITTTNKVVKAAAFGVYATGEMSKTYKCNNCGSKF